MLLRFKGGPGSGFHGHKGRLGQVGGSAPNNNVYQKHYDYLEARFGISANFKIVDDIFSEFGYSCEGVYNPEDNSITLNDKSLRTKSIGAGIVIGENVRFTGQNDPNVLISHEFGHAFDFNNGNVSLTDRRWDDIVRNYKNDHEWDPFKGTNGKPESIISKYSLSLGYSSYTELFAEAFAAYVHNPDWLQRYNPDMYDFIRDLE